MTRRVDQFAEEITKKRRTTKYQHGRKGEERHGRKRLDFSPTILKESFHLPLKQAAQELGVCEAVLKRICRRRGIPKWPYRQVSAIQRDIDQVRSALGTASSASHVPSSHHQPFADILTRKATQLEANKLRVIEDHLRNVKRLEKSPKCPSYSPQRTQARNKDRTVTFNTTSKTTPRTPIKVASSASGDYGTVRFEVLLQVSDMFSKTQSPFAVSAERSRSGANGSTPSSTPNATAIPWVSSEAVETSRSHSQGSVNVGHPARIELSPIEISLRTNFGLQEAITTPATVNPYSSRMFGSDMTPLKGPIGHPAQDAQSLYAFVPSTKVHRGEARNSPTSSLGRILNMYPRPPFLPDTQVKVSFPGQLPDF